VFAVEQVDERLEQRLDVLAAVVAELDEEMEQPQHLNTPTTTTTRAHTNTAGTPDRGRAGCGSWGGARAPFPPASGSEGGGAL